MAQDIQTFVALVPAGTAKAAGWHQQLSMPPRIVRQVEIKVPPGPRGELGFALGASGTPVIPAQAGQWIVSDDEEINWELENYLSSGGWELFAYNTGQFDHSLYLRFLCDVPGAAPGPAGVTDLSGLASLGAPVAQAPPGPFPTPAPVTLPPIVPPAPVPPVVVPPIDLPPLPPLPPVVVPPLPPISLPPITLPGQPGPSQTTPLYPQPLDPWFAAQLIVALVFGRGVGADLHAQIAADVAQLGELNALYKWATVSQQQHEIMLLDRVQQLETDWQHSPQHTHTAAQVA